jgi:hypothetical protein
MINTAANHIKSGREISSDLFDAKNFSPKPKKTFMQQTLLYIPSDSRFFLNNNSAMKLH